MAINRSSHKQNYAGDLVLLGHNVAAPIGTVCVELDGDPYDGVSFVSELLKKYREGDSPAIFKPLPRIIGLTDVCGTYIKGMRADNWDIYTIVNIRKI